MKRMSDLLDHIRGVKCSATKEAWAFLKKNKRKPYRLETPTARYIRVTIDGKKYDYSPTTGAWTPTADRGKQGRWRDSQSVEEFYWTAVNMSQGIYPPSQKQVDFLESLERYTGKDASPDAWADIKACSEEIDRLKKIRDGGVDEPKKPRLSQQEWRAASMIYDGAKGFKTPGLSELAIGLGMSKEDASALIDGLRDKGMVGGIGGHIWPVYGKRLKGEQA